MAWIGKSHGVFKLHESDSYCGSFLSIADAAEILDVDQDQLSPFAKPDDSGERWVSELDLHKRWGAGDIRSTHPSKVGAATRSFDELILQRLISITFPEATVDIQVPFGRKRMDLAVTLNGTTKGIEFLGPSHFIQQYQRDLKSPFDRKKEAEDSLGYECVLWPFWIQRCTSNVNALFDSSVFGFASVWSTKAHFGDFQLYDSARIIHDITERFGAFRDDGVGYMYLCEHTHKPVHPIIDQILAGKTNVERLIPRDNQFGDGFWLPHSLKNKANKAVDSTRYRA
jgi:hypothetical protein